MCEDCGLITLLDYVEPEVLYKAFHNDAVGRVWEEHYAAFAALIASRYTLGSGGRIVEVGAGQGKLLRILRPLCGGVMEVIDPQYEGPPEGVAVHPCLLDPASAAPLAGQFDAVVSSHTLEHFPEFNAYFSAARTVLKPGGQLFTSVPNQEFGFAKAHGSMLSFEHPSVCTNLHWLALFYRNGFQVNEVRLFRGHSIMVSAQRVETRIAFTLDTRQLSLALLEDYTRATLDRLARIRSAATPDKENWLFGAHNTAQVRPQKCAALGLAGHPLRPAIEAHTLTHTPALTQTGSLHVRPGGDQVSGPAGQFSAQARKAHVWHVASVPGPRGCCGQGSGRGRAAFANLYQHWVVQ